MICSDINRGRKAVDVKGHITYNGIMKCGHMLRYFTGEDTLMPLQQRKRCPQVGTLGWEIVDLSQVFLNWAASVGRVAP